VRHARERYIQKCATTTWNHGTSDRGLVDAVGFQQLWRPFVKSELIAGPERALLSQIDQDSETGVSRPAALSVGVLGDIDWGEE
jgi:hypothetical protein